MTALFTRNVRIIAGSLLVENLRVQFKVKKSIEKEPNECEATIYNLSESSRAALQSKGSRIVIEAGYGRDTAQIFSGDSRFIDHSHQGADWLTKIQCSDGERAYRYTRVNESFAAGQSRGTVFRRLVQGSGLDTREAQQTVDGLLGQLTQGYAAFGKLSTELDRLLKGTGLTWSIQDNRLQVLQEDAPTKDTAVLLSSSSGLIGSPVHGSPVEGSAPGTVTRKPQVLKVKSLLQPAIRPGGRIKLDVENKQLDNAVFRVLTVTHTGDTHGQDFYSEAEVVPV